MIIMTILSALMLLVFVGAAIMGNKLFRFAGRN